MPGNNSKKNKSKQKDSNTLEPSQETDIPSSTMTDTSTTTSTQPNSSEHQHPTSNEDLIARINALEKRVEVLESQLVITQTVSNHLKHKIDDQEQYSRRPCLVVNGMQRPGDEVSHNADCEAVIEILSRESNLRKETIRENIDKIHPLGSPDKNGKQLRIVKFTSDNFKESVFIKHKNRIKNYVADQKKKKKPVKVNIKLQPSLTKQRIDLLKLANEKTKDVERIKFPYADMHGNLKIRLNSPINNRYIIDFQTEDDITNIISLAGTDTTPIDDDYNEYNN